jgi:hypothetical protein
LNLILSLPRGCECNCGDRTRNFEKLLASEPPPEPFLDTFTGHPAMTSACKAWPRRRQAVLGTDWHGMRDRRLLDGFAVGCSIFVLERCQGCPEDRVQPLRKSVFARARKKSVKQADPENSKSRKRTGSGLRAARVMSNAGL